MGVEQARILVAESDPACRDALAEALAERDWAVETAAPPEAFARMEGAFYGVVVVDLDRIGNSPDWLRRARLLRPGTRVVATTAESTPAKVVNALRERAFAFFGKPLAVRAVADMAEQALATAAWEDDIEVLAGSPQWIALSVRCKLPAVDRLAQFLRELDADLTAGQRDDIAAAVRELLLNAIEHGGGSDPQKRIRVSRVRASRAVVYHIQDPGRGFSFDAIAHAAIANPPDEPVRHVEIRAENGVRPGGFGILLTRNLADELLYNEAGNEVLFVKYLKPVTGERPE